MEFTKTQGIAILIIFVLSFFIKPIIDVFLVGLLFLYVGINLVLLLIKINHKGVRVVGKILSYQAGNRGYKTPVIEFTPTGGETITDKPSAYLSTDLSKFRSYSNLINTEVEIIYDPDNPTKFIIANEEGISYMGVIICLLSGLFILGLGIYISLGYMTIN